MTSHTIPLDAPRAVRPGEELDLDRLAAYLHEHLGIEGALEVGQFPSGYSNLTYLLRAGNRELVLRRPPFGSRVKSAHDMGREYRVLSALSPVYPPAPGPLLFCDDPEVIGARFYVMERIRGIILRSARPDEFAMTPDQVRASCEAFVRNLAALHAVDYEAVGLGELRRPGSFVERQVNGWIDRYYGSRTDDIPAIDAVAQWLRANYPPDTAAVMTAAVSGG